MQERMQGSIPAVLEGRAAEELCAAAAPTSAKSAKKAFMVARLQVVCSR